MNQDTVIQNFALYLGSINNASFSVTSWPDKVNRSTPDVDALIETENTKIAIEHTTIDAVANQREDDDRFMKVVGSLENELKGAFNDRVRLTVPFYAIPIGQDWLLLKDTLKDWLVNIIPGLPHSYGYHDVQGLPFKIHIHKRLSQKPSFKVGRFDPEDKTLSIRIGVAITRKSEKLIPYKKKGYKTILLIENDDFALMNTELIKSALRTVMDEDTDMKPDQIWYADTSIDNNSEYLFVWDKE